MVGKPEVLAIVQARGGSKGIPRKNLEPLGGQPLVAYSITNGLKAQSVTRLIVSTDDEEIADVCRRYGAEVPFMRPASLATDESQDFPLFEHALKWLYEQEGYRPQVVVQLRPTAPFLPKGLVDEAVSLLLDDPAADCVRGVTESSQNPYKMWHVADDGYMTPILDIGFHESYNMPRQELPATFWHTGHIDVIRYETIINKKSLTGDNIKHVSVDGRYCVDVDTPSDLEFANLMLERRDLDIDLPKSPDQSERHWPQTVDLVVFDFDGVFTDNRVWVDQDGVESVACHRGDGMGLALLRTKGIEAAVLSTETNPVVGERCQKLGLRYQQGLEDKAAAMRSLAEEKQVDLKNTIYLGNDINDLECMKQAGFGVAVADSHPVVIAQADMVLKMRGGYGAVRELCDLIIQKSLGENDAQRI